jgi:large subunit ribosomal protein L20
MRVKTGTVRHRKHKDILKQAKGYRMGNSKRIKLAKQTVLHAGEYAFAGRKLRKRDMRRLWIQRINAALSEHEMSYSKFMGELNKKDIQINRKMLAHFATNEPEVFAAVVQQVQ